MAHARFAIQRRNRALRSSRYRGPAGHAVICDPAKLDDAGCRGAPYWIIEVLSKRTAAKDRAVKRDRDERRGVREFWLHCPTRAPGKTGRT